jgi:hypothetical protein
MIVNPRSYMNPMTRQWVFLEYNTGYGRWFPHAATMRAWANEQIRVYRPADNPATLVTMPDKHYWPAMSPSEYLYIATADVPESWVPNSHIITSLDENEIEHGDNIMSVPQLTPLTMLAGIMLSMGPAQTHQGPRPLILSVMDMPSVSRNVIENIAPAPDPRLWELGALSSFLREAQSPSPPLTSNTSTSHAPSHTTLPPHVAAIMIQHAADNGTTCPITMEPLTAKNATVTACGHIFDRDALVRWSADHGNCPECRSAL